MKRWTEKEEEGKGTDRGSYLTKKTIFSYAFNFNSHFIQIKTEVDKEEEEEEEGDEDGGGGGGEETRDPRNRLKRLVWPRK